MGDLEGLHFRRGFHFNEYMNTVKENNPYLTFPGTSFLYLPAKMSLTDVQNRFADANLRDDFKSLIDKVIEQMYNVYKIAFGIINKSSSNYGNAYRSFQGQCDLLTGSINNFEDGGSKAWITNAGPGESWHNYGYAVDLGVWQWVDTNGNEYGPDWIKSGVFKNADGKVIKNKKNRDYWLAELSKKNSSAAHAIWRMRTQLTDVPVYDLEGSEYIHLQMFPKNQSPTNELPVLLTNASPTQWAYEKADIDTTSFPPHKLRRYKCNFGETNFYTVGTAHQMWTGDKTGIVVLPKQVTAGEGETIDRAIENKKAELETKFSQIKTHMEQAQELAKTHVVMPLNEAELNLLDHPTVQRVLHKSGIISDNLKDRLDSILTGKITLNKGASSDQADIARAIQRALIYLSYPTYSSGSYGIDGLWGAGSNRGFALFLREHAEEHLIDESGNSIDDSKLIFEANYDTAIENTKNFVNVPVKKEGFKALLNAVIKETTAKRIYQNDQNIAVTNVNNIENNKYMTVKSIIDDYRIEIQSAADYGTSIDYAAKPQWIAAIARTETAGLPRPKYEHHYLYRYYTGQPDYPGAIKSGSKLTNIRVCRFNSTSFGMGQLMGKNFSVIPGASNGEEMYYYDIQKQFKVIVDFLKAKSGFTAVVLGLECPHYDDYDKSNPNTAKDINTLHRCVYAYNGSAYLTNDYHKNLWTYFQEAKTHWEIG